MVAKNLVKNYYQYRVLVTVQGGVHAIVTLGNQNLVMLQEVTSLVDAVSMRS